MDEKIEYIELSQLSKILKSLRVMAWVQDAHDKRNLFISEVTAEVLGKSIALLYAEKNFIERFIAPEDISEYKAYEALLHQKGFVEFDYKITLEEEVRWFHSKRVIQYPTEGNPQINVVDVDITSSKQQDETYKRIASVPIHSHNAIIITDKKGNIEWVNQGFEKITGYTAEEVIGRKPGNLLQGEATDVETITRISEGLKKCEPVREEILNYHKSGKPYWIWIDILPIYNEAGDLEKFIAIEVEITERKQQELLRNEAIVKHNEALRQYNYITSHNLRAPVANIIGLLSAFDTSELKNPLNKELFEALQASAQVLDETLEDLNKIVELRKNEKSTKEWVHLNDTINKIFESLNVKEKKHITIEWQVEAVFTIKGYLYSILYNLISNAIKYSSGDRPLTLTIRSVQIGNQICLSVQDNGLGIDLERYGEEIFTMYKRFHSNLPIEGKGMGLQLVKSQVETLKGKIEVESELNKGSCFRVYLPTV
ncbi:MAG: PAS domain-containing protein [Thermonemataceae bacterium]